MTENYPNLSKDIHLQIQEIAFIGKNNMNISPETMEEEEKKSGTTSIRG